MGKREKDSKRRLPKMKIQQSIPSGSLKKGPLVIVRSAALNDNINILRRFGEGSKPLFARDDVTVNQPSIEVSHDNTTSDYSCKTKQNSEGSSTESSSPERYRHRDSHKHSSPPSTARRKSPEKSSPDEKISHSYNKKHSYNTKTTEQSSRRREKSLSHTPSPLKKRKSADKLPYYRDEQREKVRIRGLYGRSSSRDKHHSPYHSSKRDYKSRRSRTRSKSRTPPPRIDREHHSSRERHKEQKDESTTVISTMPPQINPIAVPVPADYGFAFTRWTATQTSCHVANHRPPTAPPYASFSMPPIISSLRAAHQSQFARFPPPFTYGPMPPLYRPPTARPYASFSMPPIISSLRAAHQSQFARFPPPFTYGPMPPLYRPHSG